MKSPKLLANSVISIYHQRVQLEVNSKQLHTIGLIVCTFLERKQKLDKFFSDHHNALKTHLYRHELQQEKGKCD